MKRLIWMAAIAGLAAGITLPVLAQEIQLPAKGGNDRAVKIENRKKQMEERIKARKAEADKRHEKNLAMLKEKLANAKALTDAEKDEIIKFFEEQFKENVAFYEGQHAEAVKMLQSLGDEKDLSMDQKKAKMKEFIEKQKTENKEHREKQKSEREAKRDKVRSEVKNEKAAAPETTNK